MTIMVNGEARASCPADILAMLSSEKIPAARGVAVALNGDVVPRSLWPYTKLKPGDSVEIVRPVGGG